MSPEAPELDLEQELDQLHPAAFGWALACCAGDRAAGEDADRPHETFHHDGSPKNRQNGVPGRDKNACRREGRQFGPTSHSSHAEPPRDGRSHTWYTGTPARMIRKASPVWSGSCHSALPSMYSVARPNSAGTTG